MPTAPSGKDAGGEPKVTSSTSRLGAALEGAKVDPTSPVPPDTTDNPAPPPPSGKFAEPPPPPPDRATTTTTATAVAALTVAAHATGTSAGEGEARGAGLQACAPRAAHSDQGRALAAVRTSASARSRGSCAAVGARVADAATSGQATAAATPGAHDPDDRRVRRGGAVDDERRTTAAAAEEDLADAGSPGAVAGRPSARRATRGDVTVATRGAHTTDQRVAGGNHE